MNVLSGAEAREEIKPALDASEGVLDGQSQGPLCISAHMTCLLVAVSLDFDDSMSAAELEQAVSRIEARIKLEHHEVQRVFVEAQGAGQHFLNSSIRQTSRPVKAMYGRNTCHVLVPRDYQAKSGQHRCQG